MRISNYLRQVLQVYKKHITGYLYCGLFAEWKYSKNAFIAVFVANCLQNGDSVKNTLQAACMAACFKNGDWDDKSLV